MIAPFKILSIAELTLELTEEASTFKRALFLGDPKMIDPDNDMHLWSLVECAQKLKFHCDADIQRRFQLIGFDETIFRFFIPLQAVLDEFRRLEKVGIAIPFKHFAIDYISLHLETKIAHAVVNRFRQPQELNGKEVSTITRELQLLLKRKSRLEHEGKTYVPRVQGGIEMLYEIRKLEEIVGKDQAIKFFSKLSAARTDYFLINSLVSTLLFSVSDINSDKMLAQIYDFLLFICPDWGAPRNENEWEETKGKLETNQAKAQRVRDFALKENGRIRTEMPS